MQTEDLEKQIAFEQHQAKRINCSYEDLKRQHDRIEKLTGHRYLPASPMEESWLVWGASWDAAKRVPKGFILIDGSKLTSFYQDNDEPENICNSIEGLDCLGDCVDKNQIMVVNKHTQAIVSTERFYGAWVKAEAQDGAIWSFKLFTLKSEANQAAIKASEDDS